MFSLILFRSYSQRKIICLLSTAKATFCSSNASVLCRSTCHPCNPSNDTIITIKGQSKQSFAKRSMHPNPSRLLSSSSLPDLMHSRRIPRSTLGFFPYPQQNVPYLDIDIKMDQCQCRSLSSMPKDNVMNVFDRKAKRIQRDRAARSYVGEDVTVYDYLKDEFGYRLSDRICDIKRKFKTAVDLGCGRGHLSKNIYNDMVDSLIQCDMSKEMLDRAEMSPDVPTQKLVVDEEYLPFEMNSLDLVVSNLSLHWVNDLPSCLKQILLSLKNDGVLVGSMFGGDTLYEMRVSLQLAELEREGGFSPHISPYITVSDLGSLLTRAGFTMLTIDLDEVTINYPSIFELMYDLKGMAENNCSWRRKPQLHRDTLIAASSIYKAMYGNDQGVPATFQVINFIGWKPDPSQPKAAPRGSATVSIKDIGKLDQLTKEMEKIQKSKESLEKTKEKLHKSFEDPENNRRE